jgi:hypothetical protein
LTHEVLFTDHLTFPVVSQRRRHYAEIGTLFRRKYKSELMLQRRRAIVLRLRSLAWNEPLHIGDTAFGMREVTALFVTLIAWETIHPAPL